MDSDGSDQQNLTEPAPTEPTSRFSDSGPTFSPDGDEIAFLRDGDIWTMRPDGSRQRPITATPRPESYPDFSPDGRRLVFLRGDTASGAGSAIVTMRANGGGERVLVDDDFATQPVYSPDGRRVLFSRQGELLTVRAEDGGGARRIPLPRRRDDIQVSRESPTWAPRASTCSGRRPTIIAQPGEVKRGTPRADVIVATAARDLVRGRGGADVICGGAGKDTLAGGGGRDRLLGQGGPDLLKGGGGRDICLGARGRDRERSC